MNRIKRTIKQMLMLLAVAAIAACSREDDINEIFTGHTWKLTYIVDGDIRRWPAQTDNYSLQFTQAGFTATTPGGGTINGHWHADGSTREFRCTDIRSSGIAGNDTIGRLMLNQLKEASSYEGDIHFLKIIKDKNQQMQFR
ncbi:MAG: DUF4847 family protein [Bacteroidaceae bacterium]|jgi:hypothetical protein|nr:DUF4847 family protein [Bacteroidaceae bacterium]